MSLGLNLRGELLEQVPMTRWNTWRVGGKADQVFMPADVADLQTFLAHCPPEQEPFTWLGLGSNVLIADEGLRGTVICQKQGLQELQFLPDGQVRAEVGLTCAKFARECARQDLSGAAFFAGIPGTLGGALAMNAGAFGGETWANLLAVEMINRQGEVKRYSKAEFEVGYRSVRGPQMTQADAWFIAGIWQLQQGKGEAERAEIKALLAKRNASQPIGQPSCGSVFRNPPGDYAGRLIEGLNLKGFCIGGACVSEKHANFIINRGDATAQDIKQLIEQVQTEVERAYGVCLQTEVRFLGKH